MDKFEIALHLSFYKNAFENKRWNVVVRICFDFTSHASVKIGSIHPSCLWLNICIISMKKSRGKLRQLASYLLPTAGLRLTNFFPQIIVPIFHQSYRTLKKNMRVK